ncbi:MAG: DUF4390 domain-containing protein [Gammaproteobacteria bacterium]
MDDVSVNDAARNGGRGWQASRHIACALLLLSASLVAASPARAEPPFAVLKISTRLDGGVYYLDASMRLELNQRAHNALENGVALTFVVPIHILHRRLWLWNVVAAHLEERYRLRYFPLTERYQVANLNAGARESYATLAEALAAIGHIHHLPIIDANLLDKKTHYYVAMRVVLDTKQLPGPLKVAASIVPGWQLASKWHEERLQP